MIFRERGIVMKKVIFLICFILFLCPFKIFGENIQTPAELIASIKKAYENINSYSYTNEQGEYDTLTKEIQKEARKNYREENKKYLRSVIFHACNQITPSGKFYRVPPESAGNVQNEIFF